jgi:hypothetical protein
MIETIEEVAKTLRQIQLPSLTRPDVGPDDPPTLELAQYDLRAYAYSSVAYFRDLLCGLLVLLEERNVAAVHLVARGLYEWTMYASYVHQKTKGLIETGNYVEFRTIMDRVQTGNGWVKKHGDKYWSSPAEDDMPASLRPSDLVKAYKAHQLESFSEENVEDDYGYLSERAHPNSFCLSDVIRRTGRMIEFVEPTPAFRSQGTVTAAVLDWSLCIYNILALAKEQIVRREFVKMIEGVVKKG